MLLKLPERSAKHLDRDTKLLEGSRKDIVMASPKGNEWYIGELVLIICVKNKETNFRFLSEGVKYQLTLIADQTRQRIFHPISGGG